MFFVPISRNLPVFGRPAAENMLWTFTISPGFFGSGMIMGPEIALHMLAGAVVGWAILSPYANRRGWAPGPIEDWNTGSRGWIVWVSLSVLIADALVKISWICLRPFWIRYEERLARLPQLIKNGWNQARQRASSYSSIHSSSSIDRYDEDVGSDQENSAHHYDNTTATKHIASAAPYILGFGFILSILVCILATQVVFGSNVPWYYVLLSVILALPMAVVAIRSLGESDYNPQSGLGMALIFHVVFF